MVHCFARVCCHLGLMHLVIVLDSIEVLDLRYYHRLCYLYSSPLNLALVTKRVGLIGYYHKTLACAF